MGEQKQSPPVEPRRPIVYALTSNALRGVWLPWPAPPSDWSGSLFPATYLTSVSS